MAKVKPMQMSAAISGFMKKWVLVCSKPLTKASIAVETDFDLPLASSDTATKVSETSFHMTL